jgi:GNAT superfamily N-acetyltransferase
VKDIIDIFWAEGFFSCTIADFRSKQDILCPHFYLKGYNGVFVMKIFGKHLISAPESKVSIFSQMINHGHDLYRPDLLQALLGESLDQCIGPSWIGYPCQGGSANYPADYIRLLPKGDEKRHALLESLRASCGPTEWSHCGIDEASEYVALLCSGDIALSAASYQKWCGKIAHIGIITHPKFRGRGHAQNVLHCITECVRQQGLIPQYRTLYANAPAIKTATNCGYNEYASHISIRLK